MPRFANPADVFMKILAVNYPKSEGDQNKIDYLKRCYRINQEKLVTNDDKLVKLDEPGTFIGGGMSEGKATICL